MNAPQQIGVVIARLYAFKKGLEPSCLSIAINPITRMIAMIVMLMRSRIFSIVCSISPAQAGFVAIVSIEVYDVNLNKSILSLIFLLTFESETVILLTLITFEVINYGENDMFWRG